MRRNECFEKKKGVTWLKGGEKSIRGHRISSGQRGHDQKPRVEKDGEGDLLADGNNSGDTPDFDSSPRDGTQRLPLNLS